MPISRLSGQMFQSTLLRDGINLSFQDTASSNSTLYLDVANTQVGVNANNFSSTFYVNGNIAATTSIEATGNLVTSANINVTDSVNASNVVSSGVLSLVSNSSGNILIDAAGYTRVVGTDAFYVPVGNILERPVSPEPGAVRFNTTTSSLEVWDGTEWDAATNDMSVITNQTINPDGLTDTFTLDRSTTAEAIIITINGLNQTPEVDYTVAGDQVTFTTTPIETDTIQVRFIASTATITGIVNVSSYVTIGTPSGNVDIAANGVQSGTFTETGLVVSSLTASANVQLPVYTVAEAGNITGSAGQIIYVSNGDSGSPCLAVYSAGAWKRVTLGATIST